ncbi:TPA: restriction endonuclease subunit S, partial [Escherichia coli]|nr:restriction endonuclease subunit S [Escherichia coli]HBL0980213.1 restriction endonuclease subunit S [Escherichia coli]
MSEMSYLEKLLDGVEVEWKAVGDIAGYSTTKVDADKLDATSFVGVDNLLADKGGRIDATYQPNTARLTAYEPGDILLGNIRPYLKKVWMAENNGGCSGDVLAIRILADCKKIISPEYLYYALSSDSFFSYSMQHAKGAKMPRGSKDAILNYQIPIPCPSAPEKSLAIQSEIVRILDKFTALTAELTAELTMRKKQYNYYRDQLLSFEQGEVEWKTLGEITTKIASGRNKTRDADGKFPVYGSTGLIGFIDKAAYSGDLLLVARVGAYAGLVNAVSGHFDVSDNTLIIHPSDSWNVRFAFHQLRHMNLNQYAVGAGQPLITDGLLKNLKVPF